MYVKMAYLTSWSKTHGDLFILGSVGTECVRLIIADTSDSSGEALIRVKIQYSTFRKIELKHIHIAFIFVKCR